MSEFRAGQIVRSNRNRNTLGIKKGDLFKIIGPYRHSWKIEPLVVSEEIQIAFDSLRRNHFSLNLDSDFESLI